MEDESKTPVNPYRSPRLDTEDNAASPKRIYGLREPIHIQGTLSAEDLWPTEKLALRQKISAIFWLGLLFGMGGFWGLRFAQGGAALAVIVLTITVPVMIAILYLLARYSQKRRERELEENAVLERTTITEDRIIAEAEDGQAVFRWSALCQCRCEDAKVLLYFEPGGNYMVFPRRFFARDGDWEAFVDLVRWKLPEDDQSARKLVANGREAPAEPSPLEPDAEPEAREENRPIIQVEGGLSWEEWKHVQKLIGRPWLVHAVRTVCLAPFVLTLAVLIWSAPSLVAAWPVFLVAAALALFFFVLLFVLPLVQLRGKCKRQERPFAPFQVTVREEGLGFITPRSMASLPWSAFSKFTVTDRALLLHHGRDSSVRFVPRSFFSTDEEWKALLRLARRKLSGPSAE